MMIPRPSALITRLAAAVLLGLSATAPLSSSHAAVLFDSGILPTDVDNGLGSDVDFGAAGNETAGLAVLAAAGTLRSLSWTGLYGPTNVPVASDSFTLRIYADAGGTPAAAPATTLALAVSHVDTGETAFGLNIYEYVANVPDTTLAVGPIWISLVNDTTAEPTVEWSWGGQDGDVFRSAIRAPVAMNAWSQQTVTMDFTLYDEPNAGVSEPATAGLLLTAGALIVLQARRRAAQLPHHDHI